MFYSTTGLVLVALSIGEVLASPTHAHLHRKAHEKKDVDWTALNWEAMGIDWTSAWAAGRTTATAATTTATSTSVPATTTSSVKGDVLIEAVKTSTKSSSAAASTTASSTTAASAASGITIDAPWCTSIVARSNSLTEFGAVTNPIIDDNPDDLVGNVGSPEGSNMIFVSSTTGFDFTNTFINTSGDRITVVIWNKASSPEVNGGTVDKYQGPSVAPLYAPLVFSLAPGSQQIVAFANNTQNGWAEATTARSASSAFGITWGEGNFVSTGSGYDVSAIENINGNTYDMSISSVEATCVSSQTENYWLTDTQFFGSGSCYIAQSTAHLTTKMGGSL